MENALLLSLLKRRLLRSYALWLVLLSVFYALICTPLSLFLTSDVLLADTVLPMLMDGVMWVCNYLFYWISFAFLLYAFCKFGFHGTVGIAVIFGACTFFRYTANLLAGFCMIGFPTSGEFWNLYFPYLMLDILMDLVQLSIVYLILWCCAKDREPLAKGLPIAGLFAKGNRPAFVAALFAIPPAALQLIGRVIYDINFGAPAHIVDLGWMIFGYASDLVGFAAGYCVIVLLLNQFYLNETKLSIKLESTDASVL